MGNDNVPVKRGDFEEVPIASLKPFTNYTFGVKAYNGAGSSPMSILVTVQTKEDIPEQPTQVQAEEVIESKGETLKVMWQPPLRPNGNIIHYTVYYRE